MADFEWRCIPSNSDSKSIPNVLLSTCLDNVCRLWCEASSTCLYSTISVGELDGDSLLQNDLYSTIKFHLDAIIDPADFPATVSNTNPDSFDGSPVVAFSPPGFPDPLSKVESPGYTQHRTACRLHFLNSRELALAVSEREAAEDGALGTRKGICEETVKRRNRQLLETFKEYNDILFHVNDEGSIVFWGIQVSS